MAKKVAESSEATSDELKQRLSEQTSELEPAEPESEEEIQVETDDVVEEEETKEAETSEEETEPEETPTKVEKPSTHKIKVDGKEEEVDYEKLVEFAQKGRHYEKSMAELKREREELAKARQTPNTPAPPDLSKFNEEFIKAINENPFATILNVVKMGIDNEKQTTAQERREERLFEAEQAENPLWSKIKPRYQEYRDLGDSRSEAKLKAENDFLRDAVLNAKNIGQKEGQNKEKMKLKAQIPSGSKKIKAEPGRIPTPEEARKLSSAELAKRIRKLQLPI